MSNASILRAAFKLGEVIVDPEQRHVHHGDRVIDIEPKVLDLLLHLAETDGVVSRLDLLDSIWGVDGSDEALTQSISKLRRILCDTDRPYRIIVTVPKIGYRLAVQPTAAELTNTKNASSDAPSARAFIQRSFGKYKQYILGAATGAGLVMFGFFLASLVREPQHIEQEIDCPDHWSLEDCLKLIDELKP